MSMRISISTSLQREQLAHLLRLILIEQRSSGSIVLLQAFVNTIMKPKTRNIVVNEQGKLFSFLETFMIFCNRFYKQPRCTKRNDAITEKRPAINDSQAS